jgi:hypothetical protein
MTNTNQPWGFWTTVGLTLLLVTILSIAEIIGSVAYVFQQIAIPANSEDVAAITKLFEAQLSRLINDGNFLSFIISVRSVMGVGILLFFCRLRNNISIRDYLGLHPFGWRQGLFWLIVLGLFVFLAEFLYQYTGRDAIPDFMQLAYDSADNKLFLWITIILLAPVFEELLFRGFLYAGFAPTSLGVSGSILLTAFLWAVVHLQYAWQEMLMVFCLGILLGLARWRSRSILLPIVLHAANNLLASIQVAAAQG